MYGQLAKAYRQMAEILDRAGTQMAPQDGISMDALEVRAALLRARIKESESEAL
jgi:hypothetical protein